MATAHNQAQLGEIAKLVLMPGDPLRAKFIAENYLENVVQFNDIRNMFGYSGTYKGIRISVMGSGMGMPSMGIYSHELFNKYDVDVIIRIGTCGAYSSKLKLYDLALVKDCWSESTYAKTYSGYEKEVVNSNDELNKLILATAESINQPITPIRVHCTDCFYRIDKQACHTIRDEHDCDAVEMESLALFHNAAVAKKKAATILTVSDHILTNEKTTAIERQMRFSDMMNLALETLIQYSK